jgi:hypothetical protein
MINLPYHVARAEGRITRQLYHAALPLIVRRATKTRYEIPLDVFAYSGEQALPEQVASIRSFLQHAGRPRRFTVISDGTYTPRSIRLLERIHPVVTVQQNTPSPPANVVNEKTRSYLSTHPTGKQLALIMSLPAIGPALYIDSDVLFFQDASNLASLVAKRDAPAYYLADCQFSGDARLLRDSAERERPVNTGMLLLFERLDWSLSLNRFLELDDTPIFFTNQTMTHLTMHAIGARPFDPAKYVLQLDDQFVYRDFYADKSLAMRHYVNPVRHKFWTHFSR